MSQEKLSQGKEVEQSFPRCISRKVNINHFQENCCRHYLQQDNDVKTHSKLREGSPAGANPWSRKRHEGLHNHFKIHQMIILDTLSIFSLHK